MVMGRRTVVDLSYAGFGFFPVSLGWWAAVSQAAHSRAQNSHGPPAPSTLSPAKSHPHSLPGAQTSPARPAGGRAAVRSPLPETSKSQSSNPPHPLQPPNPRPACSSAPKSHDEPSFPAPPSPPPSRGRALANPWRHTLPQPILLPTVTRHPNPAAAAVPSTHPYGAAALLRPRHPPHSPPGRALRRAL
jgi:hypothetical protein